MSPPESRGNVKSSTRRSAGCPGAGKTALRVPRPTATACWLCDQPRPSAAPTDDDEPFMSQDGTAEQKPQQCGAC